MELWIRSQDKKKLCVAKYFELDNDETGIFCFNGESYSVFVGKYSTKERALEVLDEIFEILKGTKILEILNENNGNMDNLFPILTYEMPEE